MFTKKTFSKSRFSFSNESGASRVAGSFRKCKTDFLSLALLIAFSLVGSVCADDVVTCQCCGITGDVLGAITNAALANCSSNCVRLTPETCAQVKQGITNLLLTIDNTSQSSQAFISQLDTSLRDMQTSLQGLETSIGGAIDLIQSDNSASASALADIRSRLTAFSNKWASVDPPILLPGQLFVTNLNNHFTLSLTAFDNQRPMKLIRALNAQLDNINPTNTASAVLFLQESVLSLRQLQEEVENILTGLAGINNNMSDITSSAVELRQTMESFDCEPCGRGGGSSSGGSSPSIDLSPVLAELQLLRERMEYQFNRLYLLVSRFFNDYESASNNPATGKTPLSQLSGINNWFSRVERLLYNSVDVNSQLQDDYSVARSHIPNGGVDEYGSGASANNWFIRVEQLLGMIAQPKGADVVDESTNPTDPPEEMDKTDRVKDFQRDVEANETKVDQQKEAVGNTLSAGWQKISKSLGDFADSFARFGFQQTDIDGMSLELQFVVGDEDYSPFYVPAGTSAMLSKVRVAFNIIWLLMCMVLYVYALKLFFGVIIKYIQFFLKISSSTFGG